MSIFVFIVGLIIPTVLWIGYFYWRDRHFPEPSFKILFAYIMGIAIAAIYVALFYKLIPKLGILTEGPGGLIVRLTVEKNWVGSFFACIGVIGLFEEFFKLLPFIFIIFMFKEFDEKVDGIVYASLIALGFATYENIEYIRHSQNFQEILAHALCRPLVHTIFASIWGYIIAIAWFNKKNVFWAFIIGLLISAFIHGIYDFLCFCMGHNQIFVALSALLIGILWILRIKIFEKLVKFKNTFISWK